MPDCYTDEEIAAIAQKHKMPRYPKIALLREKLSRKAKIVRYADDFVILARKLQGRFVQGWQEGQEPVNMSK